MKARKYHSPTLQKILDEITPEEMEETKREMLLMVDKENHFGNPNMQIVDTRNGRVIKDFGEMIQSTS